MMNKKFLIVCYTLILIAANCALAETNDEYVKKYYAANIAYQKLQYDSAIAIYEDLVDNNRISADVYFNLGNAYFKAGNFAKAILNYERAKKLSPDDEDIQYNLKVAQLRIVDKMENVPEIFYKKWIDNFSQAMDPDSWTITFMVLIWLVFLSLSFYAFSREVTWKKLSFIALLSFILLSAAVSLIMIHSHMKVNVDEYAIVMSSSVYVKSSPDEKGNDQFILHEGTRVEILDKLNEWNKIRIANGNIGWMKMEDMEKI